MNNNILQIDSSLELETVVSQIAAVLREGEVVIAPTETKYGMLVDASNEASLQKLFEIKGRPDFMPTAVFVKTVDEIKKIGALSQNAEKFAKQFLPGPLTIVIDSVMSQKKYLTQEGKIGIRVSSSELIQRLLEKVEFPITATSANLSGQPDCITIEELSQLFEDKVALYIDGGILDGDSSTVVDISSGELIVLREGAVKQEQLKEYWK